jgi:Xaa-Pro aminopeptidase
MKNEADVRIPVRISDQELERRWALTRELMKDRKLDFLVFQNSTDYLDGYVKWFTDLPALHNYPATVIFELDDEMTTVWHGPDAPADPRPPAWSLRGVKKRLSRPYLPSLNYSVTWDAEMVVEELSSHKGCRVGLIGLGFMTAAFYNHLTKHLSAEFEDVTDQIDHIKAIKSDEEFKHIRDCCQMQDEVFEYTLSRVQPGRRDFEIYADIRHRCMELGSEQAIIMVGSAPYGTAGCINYEHLGNRMIEDGDTFTVLLEPNNASGFYGHLARTICLGKASPELLDHTELVKEAQRITLEHIKPGAGPLEAWDANNQFMRRKGYPEETRLLAHGQGYDLVERPSLNPGETMGIKSKMNMSIHPTVASEKAFAHICDNFMIKEDGTPERLHKTEQKVFVI